MEQTMDSTQIEELWTTVSHYVTERQKLDCAVDFVKTLVDQGVSIKTLKAAQEYDDKLTEAITIVLEDAEDDEYVDTDNYYEDE
jgi:hypothetical protein|tara:strand:+ start:1936 stop:2187 length:252 start_codon:yes stop_codon:yes gene_type:complete